MSIIYKYESSQMQKLLVTGVTVNIGSGLIKYLFENDNLPFEVWAGVRNLQNLPNSLSSYDKLNFQE